MIIKKIFGKFDRKKKNFYYALVTNAQKTGILGEEDGKAVEENVKKLVYRKMGCFFWCFGGCLQARFFEDLLTNILIDGIGGIYMYRVVSYYLLRDVYGKLEKIVEKNQLDKRIEELKLRETEKEMLKEISQEVKRFNNN